MLDDHICHELAVGVPLLVQTVHLVELDLERSKRAIVCTAEDRVGAGMDGHAPNPVTHFADDSQSDAFLIPQGHFLVTSGHQHVLTSRVETD